MGSWYQDQWWDSGTWGEESETKGFGSMEKRWRGSREKLQNDGGSTFKGEGGYSDSENENSWRRPGRREGRGSETKTMIWPDWCEEEAVVANMEVSEEIEAETSGEVRRTSNRCEDEAAALAEGYEEIQMEVEARKKREEVVAREIEEIAGEESLGCALGTFEVKKEAEKKRRDQRRRGGKTGAGARETDEGTVG